MSADPLEYRALAAEKLLRKARRAIRRFQVHGSFRDATLIVEQIDKHFAYQEARRPTGQADYEEMERAEFLGKDHK